MTRGLWVFGWVLLCATTARASWAENDPIAPPDKRFPEHENLVHMELGCPLGETNLYWERGPTLESIHGNFVLHLGGRLQYDTVWYGGPGDAVEAAAVETWETGSEFRRAQLLLEGWIGRYWYFKARFDAKQGDGSTFQDIYADWEGLFDRTRGKIPRIRMGQFKEPISLEMLTSSGVTTFMEYSLPVRALMPFRNVGASLLSTPVGEHVTVEAGVFATGAGELSDVATSSGYAFTGRAVWRKLNANDPCNVLHLGLGASFRTGNEDNQLSTRAETHIGPAIVDTGEFESQDRWILDLEALVIRGRLSAQAEYIVASGSSDTDVTAHGGYAQCSYCLTPGTCRNYATSRSVFRRIVPEHPVDLGKNDFRGVWEAAARASYVDLDDGPLRGGSVFDVTLGLNWYLSDQVRITFNYVFSNVWTSYGVAGADGILHSLGMRFAVEW